MGEYKQACVWEKRTGWLHWLCFVAGALRDGGEDGPGRPVMFWKRCDLQR